MGYIDINGMTITPGIYGVVEHLPIEILRRRWEALREQVFDKEPDPIYRRAMEVCAVVRCTKYNLNVGKKIFKQFLNEHGMNFDEYDFVPDAILLRYWELSKSSKLWRQRDVVGGHVPYKDALAIWLDDHQEDIEGCRRDLDQWLNQKI